MTSPAVLLPTQRPAASPVAVPPPVPAEITAELDALADSLARLRQVEWWRLPDDGVLAAAARVEQVLRSGYGVQIRLAADIAERGIAQAAGQRSCAQLLAGLLRIPIGQARARIDAARAGLGVDTIAGEHTEPVMPELLIAIDAGAICDEHAAVITAAKIPSGVDDATRAACHDLLLTEARQRDPVALKKVTEQIRLICNPDGTGPGPDPVDRAELHIGTLRPDGLTPIHGLLDPLTCEQLRVAVEALAAPRPIDDRTPDPRPAPLRRAHALTEILTRYVAAGCSSSHPDAGPPNGGIRPVVAVTININDLPRQGRPHGALPAQFDYGNPASPDTARILACDGIIIRQIIDDDGAILDQGRGLRLFTRAQRRALITRDKGCAFPGCDIPAGWCEAHHITYWSHGGRTDLDNGVLLCRYHHTVIHQEHWHIQPADPDTDGDTPGPATNRGRPWFIPPPHIDPERGPRRNNHFHLPHLASTIRRT